MDGHESVNNLAVTLMGISLGDWNSLKMDGHESVNNLAVTLMGISLGDRNSVSFDDLPIELVVDILSRLPCKSALVTTCVSKRLYSIIKTPVFVAAHHSISMSNPSNKFILLLEPKSSVPNDHILYVYSNDNLLSLHAKIKIPFERVSDSLQLVGSCNGLVCISITYSRSGRHSGGIYLINPFVQNYKKLNAEDSCYPDLLTGSKTGCYIVMGFGYSDVENDYKVVRSISGREIGSSKIWSKAEVYSLRSGKWKEVISDSDYGLLIATDPLFVDGCLYWLSSDNDSRRSYLQCFDLNDEVFRKIELPAKFIELCSDHVPDTYQLNGSLALVILGYRLCVFVMEKGRDNSGQVHWKELYFEVNNEEGGVSLSYFRLGHSCRGRLESEDLDSSYEMDGESSDVKDRDERIGKLFAINLDNLNALETCLMDFEKGFTVDINFIGSLAPFF